jgi:hypothetical protein
MCGQFVASIRCNMVRACMVGSRSDFAGFGALKEEGGGAKKCLQRAYKRPVRYVFEKRRNRSVYSIVRKTPI